MLLSVRTVWMIATIVRLNNDITKLRHLTNKQRRLFGLPEAADAPTEATNARKPNTRDFSNVKVPPSAAGLTLQNTSGASKGLGYSSLFSSNSSSIVGGMGGMGSASTAAQHSSMSTPTLQRTMATPLSGNGSAGLGSLSGVVSTPKYTPGSAQGLNRSGGGGGGSGQLKSQPEIIAASSVLRAKQFGLDSSAGTCDVSVAVKLGVDCC